MARASEDGPQLRMAGDERPGRLCVRHVVRRDHAALPRLSGGGAPRAVRPRHDAERTGRSASSFPDGRFVQLSGEERAGDPVKLDAMEYISEFRLEAGTPVWRFEIGSITIEKRLVLPHGQNTCFHQLFAALRRRQRAAGAAAVHSFPPARNAGERRIGIYLHADGGTGSLRSFAGNRSSAAAAACFTDRTRR